MIAPVGSGSAPSLCCCGACALWTDGICKRRGRTMPSSEGGGLGREASAVASAVASAQDHVWCVRGALCARLTVGAGLAYVPPAVESRVTWKASPRHRLSLTLGVPLASVPDFRTIGMCALVVPPVEAPAAGTTGCQ